jgi:hypothetical protein
MKVYNLPEAYLSIMYPDGWAVEREKNMISAFDPVKGVGVLQFSFYQIAPQKQVSLKDELEEYIRDKHEDYEITISDNCAFSNYLLGKNSRRWKYWLFLKVNVLTFVSYNCHESDIGVEEKTINDIVLSAI